MVIRLDSIVFANAWPLPSLFTHPYWKFYSKIVFAANAWQKMTSKSIFCAYIIRARVCLRTRIENIFEIMTKRQEELTLSAFTRARGTKSFFKNCWSQNLKKLMGRLVLMDLSKLSIKHWSPFEDFCSLLVSKSKSK